MDKEQILNELQKLYRLRDEGKNVDVLIYELEEQLFGEYDYLLSCDDEEEED